MLRNCTGQRRRPNAGNPEKEVQFMRPSHWMSFATRCGFFFLWTQLQSQQMATPRWGVYGDECCVPRWDASSAHISHRTDGFIRIKNDGRSAAGRREVNGGIPYGVLLSAATSSPFPSTFRRQVILENGLVTASRHSQPREPFLINSCRSALYRLKVPSHCSKNGEIDGESRSKLNPFCLMLGPVVD
jgi:hypothetical protein